MRDKNETRELSLEELSKVAAGYSWSEFWQDVENFFAFVGNDSKKPHPGTPF